MTPLVAGLPCIEPHDLSFAPCAQSEASQNNSYTEEETPMNEWFSNRRMSEPIETTQTSVIPEVHMLPTASSGMPYSLPPLAMGQMPNSLQHPSFGPGAFPTQMPAFTVEH